MISAQEVQDRMRMTDGFDLFYRRWIPRSEGHCVVLCVHGGGRNSEYFEILGEALSQEGIKVYAPDLRGFGNSVEKGRSRGDTNFKRQLLDLADAVNYVREKHPGKKVFMLGHSYGGNYVVWYAANYPDSLHGMVLLGPRVVSSVRPPPSLMIKAMFSSLLAPSKLLYDNRMWPESERGSAEVKFYENNPLDTTAMSARFMMGLGPFLGKTLKNAGRVTTPTLLVQGGADGLTLPIGAQKLLDGLAAKDKSLKTLPEADHFYYHTIFPRSSSFQDDLTKRKQVTDIVGDWIKSHSDSSK